MVSQIGEDRTLAEMFQRLRAEHAERPAVVFRDQSDRVLWTYADLGRNADAVADLTLAFLLMLARHLGPMRDTFREGAARITDAGGFLAMYNRFTGVELGGRTVGLVALGAVGREVAARLGAFKARVLAYDP